MSFRDAFNAINGFSELKRQEFAVMFNISQMNAFYTTSSEKQQRQLKRMQNPYIEKKIKTGKPLTMNDVSPIFQSISKN